MGSKTFGDIYHMFSTLKCHATTILKVIFFINNMNHMAIKISYLHLFH
jgi:hypothetical protein